MIILEVFLYTCAVLMLISTVILTFKPTFYKEWLGDKSKKFKGYFGIAFIIIALFWLIGGTLSYSGIFILAFSILYYFLKKYTLLSNVVNLISIILVFANKFYIRNDWWYNLINENLAASIFLLVVYLFLIGKYHKPELS